MTFSAIIILLACAVNLGCSVTLELYSGQHYSGLLKNITLDKIEERECTQFNETYEVRSIKTDKCVMIYETADCKHIDANAPGDWAMYSVRVERDAAGLFDVTGTYSNRKEERRVQSFHVCNRYLGGGATLDVDIFGGPNYRGELLASYGGVCECKNIPSNIVTKGKRFSIDNYGNSIYFYDKENCTGLQRLIPAGDNERSRSVFQFTSFAEVMRSFRPVDDLSCPPNLDAEIYWFDFSNGSKPVELIEDVQQYLTTSVTNTRPFASTVFFNTSIPITVKYSIAKAFTYLHTLQLKAGHYMKFDDEVTALLGGNSEALSRSLEANYQYTNASQSRGTIDVTIPMQDQGSIDLAACETCELTYSVRRFAISYVVPAIVTGNDKMSEEQLVDLLPPDMKFIAYFSGYGFFVAVNGEMKADLFFRDDTKKVCKSVPDCNPN